jgi:hypothetical protein
MRLIISYLIGLVFGVGIAISGMANPAKVLNFRYRWHLGPEPCFCHGWRSGRDLCRLSLRLKAPRASTVRDLSITHTQ